MWLDEVLKRYSGIRHLLSLPVVGAGRVWVSAPRVPWCRALVAMGVVRHQISAYSFSWLVSKSCLALMYLGIIFLIVVAKISLEIIPLIVLTTFGNITQKVLQKSKSIRKLKVTHLEEVYPIGYLNSFLQRNKSIFERGQLCLLEG